MSHQFPDIDPQEPVIVENDLEITLETESLD